MLFTDSINYGDASGASSSDFPFSYQATLQLTHRGNIDFCSAAIINSLLLVTVAHCVNRYNASKKRAVTGRRSLRTLEGTEQVRNISEIIRHDQYNRRTFDHDIALLVLDQPLEFDDFMRPIGIPEENVD